MTQFSHGQLRKRLEEVSQEMISLIRRYGLDAGDPLSIIPQAKDRITDHQDYVRFLELSLEGRLIGEAAEHLANAEQANSPSS